MPQEYSITMLLDLNSSKYKYFWVLSVRYLISVPIFVDCRDFIMGGASDKLNCYENDFAWFSLLTCLFVHSTYCVTICMTEVMPMKN